MRRYVPRALLTAAVAVSAAACTVGPPPGTTPGSVAVADDPAGRAQVLVPAFTGSEEGERVADRVRDLLEDMATHTSVPEGDMNRAMTQFGIEQLNEATSRQLAQQMNAEVVLFGSVSEGAGGLTADLQVVDNRTGDQIDLEATGADRNALADAIIAEFGEAVEGIRLVGVCNGHVASGNYQEAVTACDEALAVVPRSASALYAKATALVRLENDREALQAFRQLLEIDPVHQDALLQAGLAASRLQEDDAATFYNRYIELNPGDPNMRITVAAEAAKAGDYIAAYRVLEPAVAQNASNVDFQRTLFTVATAAGQRVQEQQDANAARPYFETARNAYNAAFGSGGAELDASALRLAIAVNQALGDTEGALRIARDATAKFDTIPSIWSQYATVLADADRPGEAVQALSRVIELDPDFPDVYMRRAQLNLEAGNTDAAIADFQTAAGRGNREQVAAILYGMAREPIQQEQFAEAARYLELAHQFAEGNVKSDISFFWGYMLYKQGEAIAKANPQPNREVAQQALAFFEQAIPLLESSANPTAANVLTASQQYRDYMRAVIAAARG